jgi:gas vesicle protein
MEAHIPEGWEVRPPSPASPATAPRKNSFFVGLIVGSLVGAVLGALLACSTMNSTMGDPARIRAQAFAEGEEHARRKLAEAVVAYQRVEANKALERLSREIERVESK